jgi:hypothetical protein
MNIGRLNSASMLLMTTASVAACSRQVTRSNGQPPSWDEVERYELATREASCEHGATCRLDTTADYLSNGALSEYGRCLYIVRELAARGELLPSCVSEPSGAKALQTRHARNHLGSPASGATDSLGDEDTGSVRHASQLRLRLVSRRAWRARRLALASCSGTPSPRPKYTSSGVCPWKAACGIFALCSLT